MHDLIVTADYSQPSLLQLLTFPAPCTLGLPDLPGKMQEIFVN